MEAFRTNYFLGLMAARWFLGLAEAGLFPGVNYYLSAWYKRRELGIRAAIFFSAAALVRMISHSRCIRNKLIWICRQALLVVFWLPQSVSHPSTFELTLLTGDR